MTKSTLILIFSFLSFQNCNSQESRLSEYYNVCMEQKKQGNNFIQDCEKLEGVFINIGLLKSKKSSAYLELIERLTDDNLSKSLDDIRSNLESFQDKNNIEIDAFYSHFLECMYSAIVKNETSTRSTNYVQFHTIKEMQNTSFTYVNYKAMINYSVKNNNFKDIENRVPLLLGLSYHILFEK